MRRAPRVRPGWRAVPVWISEHKIGLGWPLAAIVAFGLWFLLGLRYQPDPVYGRISGFGRMNDGGIIVNSATVEIADRTVQVPLPIRYGCRVGDHVRMREMRMRWGSRYRVEPSPAPCSPTPFPQQS